MKAVFFNPVKVSKSVSFDGYEFDIYSDKWQLNINKYLNVSFIVEFDDLIQNDIRETLVYFAETKSASHAVNVCLAIKNYYDKTSFRVINEKGLLTYKALYSSKSQEHRLGVLRVFLKQLYFLEFNAVSDQLFELMNSWSLSGNDKGMAVLSLDPEEGPFSDIEFDAIRNGLDNKYAESVINDREYSLAQMFAATGRRPIQIASLKVGDFRMDSETLGETVCMLSIPKAKVRGGKFRSRFTDFALLESTGQVLIKHIENIKKTASQVLGRKLSESECNLLPLFPDDWVQLTNVASDDVESWLTTDSFHCKTREIVSELKDVVGKLDITSERTGNKIKITGYRFRYTLGTRAAREGAGVLTIAKLLDQSDTQNTTVYVANIPEHAVKISAFMNNSLMRYARAFEGEIVDSEYDVLATIPGAQRIRSSDNSCNVGSCGTTAMCHDYAPIACYLCPKFKAWRDAPHHEVLKWLLDERERVIETTNDLQIATINDRAILAVTQVIQRCAEMKGDIAYG
ncbi:site-specific integrase [Methylomonas sp. ZR1]|uniref:site-specific integrase n=1 Tax=Methylomonas sp. ZR1 TaxID=1797072 RepID=UPI001491E2C7|nr:site-specific integrase [Methylomonas sp. ZR1]NOV29227.1 site-specific integrase [Methylomonas sp. ZR1]